MFFKEQKLFFIHQKPYQICSDCLSDSLQYSILSLSKPPNTHLNRLNLVKQIVNLNFLKKIKFSESAKQVYGLWQVVLHAKMQWNVLYLTQESRFLFFILWNLGVFKKNKPCQHDCNWNLSTCIGPWTKLWTLHLRCTVPDSEMWATIQHFPPLLVTSAMNFHSSHAALDVATRHF